MEPIVVAVVGVVGAAIGATLSSWLGAREAVRQELPDLRLKTYGRPLQPVQMDGAYKTCTWARPGSNRRPPRL